MEWSSCWTVITSAAVTLSRQVLAIACCFVYTTAGASCPRPAPRAGAGCNGQAERLIGSDHGETRFYNDCHRYCRSRGQITERPKGNGARSGTDSICPRKHVHSGKCSEVNSGNSPNFSKKLEKFGEVWRSLEKFGEVWRVWRKVVMSRPHSAPVSGIRGPHRAAGSGAQIRPAPPPCEEVHTMHRASVY